MIFSLIVLTVSYVRNCASILPEPVPEFGKIWTQLRYPPDFPTVKTLLVYGLWVSSSEFAFISLHSLARYTYRMMYLLVSEVVQCVHCSIPSHW